jgi:hypothetical protein
LLVAVNAVLGEHFSAERTDEDVHAAARALKASSIDAATKSQQLKNLKAMDHDLKHWKTASPAQRTAIRRDLQTKMATIRQVLSQSKHHQFESIAETPTFHQDSIEKELSQIRVAIQESNLDSDMKSTMGENINSILRDTQRIRSSSSADEKKRIWEAVDLRIQALKEAATTPSSKSAPKETSFEEKHHDVVSSIVNDVEQVRHELEASSLDATTKLSMEENLSQINEDARKYAASSSEAEKSRLKQAINLRTQALHEVIGAEAKPASFAATRPLAVVPSFSTPHFDTPAASAPTTESSMKVIDDIARLQAKISASSLSLTQRQAVSETLESIRMDAEKVATASPSMREALKEKMQAATLTVRRQLEQLNAPSMDQEEVKSTTSTATRVLEDVSNIKASLATTTMSTADRKEIEDNLQAIERDATKFTTASTTERTTLKEAIKLRMSALRQQLSTVPSKSSQFEEDAHIDAEDDIQEEFTAPKATDVFAKSATNKLQQLTKSISTLDISSEAKHEAKENIRQMEEDLTKIKNGENVANMKKALGLRLKALQQQLAQDEE